MAQVDSRIAMGVQPLDVGASIGRGYQLRDLAAQADARKLDTQLKQQGLQKQNTLGDLYRGAVGTDGKIDQAKLTQGVVQAGYGADLPSMQKEWSDSQKSELERQAKTLENSIKANDYITSQVAALLMKPGRAPADAYQTIDRLAQAGIMSPEQAQQYRAQVPTNSPQSLETWLRAMLGQSLKGKEQLEAIMPKVEAINLGGHTQMVDMNPMTNPQAVGQRLDRSATIGEQESARHNRASEGISAGNLAVSRQRLAHDQQTPRGQIVTTADGGVMLVDPRGGTAQPVRGPDGQQIAGKMPGQLTPKQIADSRGKLQTITTLRMQIDNLKKERDKLGDLNQGPLFGRNPLSEGGNNFDGALAALQTTVRQLTRTPGEGAMSDYESRLANAQLPSRTDFGSTIDQKIAQLEDLANVIETGYTGMLDSAPGQRQPPADRAAAPAASNIDALLEKYK